MEVLRKNLLMALPLFALLAGVCYAYGQPSDSYSVSKDTGVTQEVNESLNILQRYTKRVLVRFDKSPLFITILYLVIVYSLITMLVLLTIILLNRGRMKREEEIREQLKEDYQLRLMDYLFESSKRDRAYEELSEIASNRFNRQILIDQMMDLSINLKGELKEDIKRLYLSLGLQKDSLWKVYHKKWHHNVKGYRELAFMNIREANEQILQSLNSNNQVLRMEAQIALVSLSDDNPYHFLHDLKKPLSVWEQITLHEMLVQNNLAPPAFKQWFTSENTSILIFSLEMLAWFEQKGHGKELMALFEHENDQVRNTAYKVAGELGLKSTLAPMKRLYPGENFRNKLSILQSFARMPHERHLGFLKKVLDDEENVQLQIASTKAMENTGEPGISMLIRLMKSKSEYRNYQIIIRHVLDGRIY